MDVYIYYAVATAGASSLRPRVLAVQQHLAAAYEITTELKLRVDDAGAAQTWMEIYHQVPAGFDRVIEHAAAEAGIGAVIEGARHVEIFRDFELCA
jgi:hypothetical protein